MTLRCIFLLTCILSWSKMAICQRLFDGIPATPMPNQSLHEPPPHLLPWLTYTGYMSERLRARSGDAVLQVLQHGWEPSNAWDQHILGIAPEKVLHRDVLLLAWGQPCWFARTILPETTYQAHQALFQRLDSEPLGNLIFHTDEIKRLNLRYYPIQIDAPEYTWLPKTVDTQRRELWLRLSTFQVHQTELFYLVEILLPALEQYTE